MQLVNLTTGQIEDVPDDQAQAALQSKTHGLDPSAVVPVEDTYGQIKQVPAGEVERAVGKGGRIASQDEARQYDLEQRRGGLGHQAIAGAEGLARGVTLGLSDPLAIEAARAWGGDDAATAVRTHLSEEQAAHHKTAVGGEILGAVAPILATAGEAAPEEAVELAGRAARPSLLGTVVRNTPAALTGRLGSAVERATTEVLGSPAASSALGRIAKAAASSALSGGVEGAIYGAGGQLSEDALGDHETTAQKFLAAMGHGFVWGAVLGGASGGGLQGASEAAKPLLRRVGPHLEGKAGETAWEALGGSERTASEAADVGGVKAVGQTVLDKTGLHEGSLHGAALASEEMAPKLDAALAKQRVEIDKILQMHGAKPGEVVLPDLAGIRQLRKQTSEWAPKGLDAVDMQAKRLAIPETVHAELKTMAQDYERLLIARDVNARSVEATAAAKAANPASGLPFSMGAAWTAAHAAMIGHIPGAVGILAASAGKKLIAERGQMLAAVTMSKIARMDLLARAVNSVDRDLEHTAGSLVGRKTPKAAERFTGPGRDTEAAGKWGHAHTSPGTSDRAMATAQHWEGAFPGLKAQAPKVTNAALRTLNAGAIYLAAAKPQRLDTPTLVDPRPVPRVSHLAAEEHQERVRAVHDPVGTLDEGIRTGTLSASQVEAVATTSPRVLDTLRAKVIDELSKPHPPLSDAKVRTISILFQGQGDELSSPEMGAMIHAAYAKLPGGAPQTSAVTPTAPAKGSKPVKGFATAGKTKLEQVHDSAGGM